MRRNERARRDWLDRELDQPSGSERADDLTATARHLQRLYEQQRQDPDEQFVRRLERTLMPTASDQPMTQPLADRQDFSHREGRTRLERSRPRRTSMLTSAMSVGLLFAIVAATAFVAWRNYPSNNPASDPDPVSTGALAQAATPDATEPPEDEGTTPSAANVETAWEIALPPTTRAGSDGGFVVADGTLYRLITIDANENDSFEGVEAIDAETGIVSRRYHTPWVRNALAADETAVYFGEGPFQITAAEQSDGSIRWSAPFERRLVAITLGDGVLYAWDESNAMTAIDVTDGSILWTTPSGDDSIQEMTTDGTILAQAAPVVGTTNVAMISADGTLYAFDRDSGAVDWTMPGFDTIHSRITVTDDVLLVLTLTDPDRSEWEPPYSYEGIGIDLVDGTVKWEIAAETAGVPVAPGRTGLFYLVADSVATTTVGAAATPSPIVDATAEPNTWTWPTAAIPPDHLQGIPAFLDVYGIDAQSGEVVWIRSTNEAGACGVTTAPSSSDTVWVSTCDGQIVTLSGETGAILGPAINTGQGMAITGLIVGTSEESLFVTARGGLLLSYDIPPTSG